MTSDDVITGEAPARYAEALIDLAGDAKTLNRVEKDLSALAGAFHESAELTALAGNPSYATEDKLSAILAVAKATKAGPLTQKFIGTVVSNRRASDIPDIIAAFNAMLAEKRGTKVAKVTSATPLTQAQLTQLKSKLKAETGQAVDVETDVDPSLLGGFRVKLGSRLFDASLKTKLEDLRLALKS